MTLVAYTKIKPDSDLKSLWTRVEKAFSKKENEAYFSEIRERNNQDGNKESLSALLVLAALLERADIPSYDLILDRHESGKPYFASSTVEFSLSHSHGYAAAAISDSSRVGIDLEATEIPPEKAAKLAARFFSDGDKRELEADPDSFLRIWTKKEALAKMLGTPLSELIAYEKNSPARPRKAADFHCLSADGHPLTVCLEKPCELEYSGKIIV